MLRYLPIKSGSGGNCIYLDFNGSNRLILDCGVDHVITKKILHKYGCDKYWSNVYLSHDHKDHSQYHEMYLKRVAQHTDRATVMEFKLPHGDIEVIGRMITYEHYCVLWMTDFQEIPDSLKELIKDIHFDLVLIEANYSKKYLIQEKNPELEFRAKRHHSLEDTLDFLSTISFTTAHLIHLSDATMHWEYLYDDIKEYGMEDRIRISFPNELCEEMYYVNYNKNHARILQVLKDKPPKGWK